MGKLAERLSDPRRSGVYRVESTDALEEAVALNGFCLNRIDLEGISADALCGIAAKAVASRADGNVLLLTGFEALARGTPLAFERLIAELQTAAASRREGGMRLFAAFMDPSARLSLAPLYNWHRSRSVKVA